MNKTVSGVSLALGLLGGCTGGDPVAPPPPPTGPSTGVVTTEGQEDLQRLRDLQVFEVGRLVVALPAEATACYGYPCPGWEDQVATEVGRQLPRLERLAQAAEELRGTAGPGAAPAPAPAEVEAALQELRDLRILEVGDLMLRVPDNDPNCYNLPCPDDVEAADRENASRAGFVTRLAERARRDGI
jgi:hypothetical protein